MTDFKIVPSIDLNDPYAQAKLDVIKAKESISKLTPIQQRALVEELFGVAFVDMIISRFDVSVNDVVKEFAEMLRINLILNLTNS